MKKFPSRIFATLYCGVALAVTSNAATLVTHYDFEGDTNTIRRSDKALGGSVADNLTAVGTISHPTDTVSPYKPTSTVAQLTAADNALTAASSVDNTMSGSFSIALWIKYDKPINEQEDFNAVISKRTGSGNSNYWMGQGEIGSGGVNNAFRVSFDYSGGNIPGFIQYSQDNYVETDWHHYAMTFDTVANTLKFYLDGLLTATSTNVTQEPYTDSSVFTIGRRGTQNNDFDGWVDDVRLYKGVLTDYEVYSLAVPEPSTLALVALVGLAMVGLRRCQ